MVPWRRNAGDFGVRRLSRGKRARAGKRPGIPAAVRKRGADVFARESCADHWSVLGDTGGSRDWIQSAIRTPDAAPGAVGSVDSGNGAFSGAAARADPLARWSGNCRDGADAAWHAVVHPV